MSNAQEREDLRHVILEILVVRHPAALPPQAIRRRAANELDFALEDADVAAGLAILEDLGYAKREPDALGSTHYWSATAAGVLAFERGATSHTPHRD